MTNKKVTAVDFILEKEASRAGKTIDRIMMKTPKEQKGNNYIHAITNVSLHDKLDGSQYVGWLLNKAGGFNCL